MDFSKLMNNEYYNMILDKLNLSELSKIDFSNIATNILYIIIAILTSVIILWLLKAIGLYTMAKRNGDKYAFLSFIPYGCLFVKGRIIGNTKLFGIEISKPELILPLLVLTTFLPFAKTISMLLLIIFYYGILYRLYQKQVPNFAIVLLILSIVIPFTQPFIIFFIRNANKNTTSNAN